MRNNELKQMLEDCRKNDDVSSEVLNAVESIAQRYLTQDICKLCDKDIVVNNVLIRFCKVWKRINPKGNIFAYVTSIVRNENRMYYRSYRLKNKFLENGLDISELKLSSEKFQTRKVCSACC